MRAVPGSWSLGTRKNEHPRTKKIKEALEALERQ
jgi:hypothetical protein